MFWDRMSFYLSVPLGCFSVRIICGFPYHRNAVSASLGPTPTSVLGRHRAAAASNTFCFRIARQELVSRSVALGAGSDLGVGLSLGLGVGWLACGRGLWGFWDVCWCEGNRSCVPGGCGELGVLGMAGVALGEVAPWQLLSHTWHSQGLSFWH